MNKGNLGLNERYDAVNYKDKFMKEKFMVLKGGDIIEIGFYFLSEAQERADELNKEESK